MLNDAGSVARPHRAATDPLRTADSQVMPLKFNAADENEN
jgi:hypothetical protein